MQLQHYFLYHFHLLLMQKIYKLVAGMAQNVNCCLSHKTMPIHKYKIIIQTLCLYAVAQNGRQQQYGFHNAAGSAAVTQAEL